MLISRTPYTGPHRDLVVAIDYGTTCSGVSYSILEPGFIPQIRSVSGFEGQDANSTKVPSILYYDVEGNLRAVGSQINNPQRDLQKAENERWIQVTWLKLLFRPQDQVIQDAALPEVAVPNNKSPVQVLGDFLRYLADATRDHIIRTEVGGDNIWKDVEERIAYVLSYPNGWKDSQCSVLKQASLYGKLIPDARSARERLRFISEGEASFYWCLGNVETTEDFSVERDVIVADLGGGTIDVSSYRIASKYPVKLKEKRPPQGRLAGSIAVNRAFRTYIDGKLWNFDRDPLTIEHVNNEFERNTKKAFRDPSNKSYISLGTDYHDPRLDIYSGVLQVPGSNIRDMFEPSCRAATDAIRSQILSKSAPTTVFLVGGFAASPWLFAELQRRLSDYPAMEVKRAQKNDTAKAVAEGAVSHYLDHFVSHREAEFTYGTFVTLYDPRNRKHTSRKKNVYTEGGSDYLRGGFTPLWKKGDMLTRHPKIWQEVKYRRSIVSSGAYSIELDLTCYQGSIVDIACEDEDPGNFRRVCIVKAELPASGLKWGVGRYYRTLTYHRVFTFEDTEPTCYLEWRENGHPISVPAVPVVHSQGSRFASEIRTSEDTTLTNPPPKTRGERSSIRHKSKNSAISVLRPTPESDPLSSVEANAHKGLVAVAPHAEPIEITPAAQAVKGYSPPRSKGIAWASNELESLEGKTHLDAEVELEDLDAGATTIVDHYDPRPPTTTADLTSARGKSIPVKPNEGSDDVQLTQENLVLSDQNAHLVDLPDDPPTTGGGFCELYIGFYRPTGRKLAMKRPKTRFPTDDILRRFRREAEIWATLEHANIVPFFGTLEIRQSLYLVSPWMALGDLMEFAQTRSQYIKDGKLDEHIKDDSIPHAYSRFNEPRIVREIASGMEYLHSSGIIHGDMKAKNVLLDARCSAKICDFGLTKTLDHSVTSTALFGAGSVRWQSPELFDNVPKSSQSDIYAFAFTIVEILTGEHPFPHLKGAIAIMRAVVDRHERPAFEPISQLGVDFSQLWKVAAQCWAAKPEERLTMTEVLQQLGSSEENN